MRCKRNVEAKGKKLPYFIQKVTVTNLLQELQKNNKILSVSHININQF